MFKSVQLKDELMAYLINKHRLDSSPSCAVHKETLHILWWPSLQMHRVASIEPHRVSRCWLGSRKQHQIRARAQLLGRAEGESRRCNAISPAPAGFTSFQTWHLKFRCRDEMQQART